MEGLCLVIVFVVVVIVGTLTIVTCQPYCLGWEEFKVADQQMWGKLSKNLMRVPHIILKRFKHLSYKIHNREMQ